MDEEVQQIIEEAANSPLVQAVMIALSTYVLEDPTTIGTGLLIAAGEVGIWTGFFALWFGIASGDCGLYALGWICGRRTIAWGWVREERLEQARTWLDRNLLLAILVSRFVPGMRLPTYLGAGIVRAHPVRFLAITVGAVLLWTTALLALTIQLGEAVMPLLGGYRWHAAIAFILLIIVIQWAASRYGRRKLMAMADSKPVVSRFEFWPPYLFYLPVGLYYGWLALRHRSITLPSISNPSIYSGGMLFESKNDILDLVPESQKRWFAPHARFLRPADLDGAVEDAEDALRAAGIDYPIVAKPDQGQRGIGVQPVHDRAQLAAYIESFPAGCAIQFQALVPWGNEAGILYYRYPGADKGRIFSATRKLFPAVTGDGTRTLRELILADPRAGRLQHIYLPRHAARVDAVIPAGETYPLVFAGSHARGAIFKDGRKLVTPALSARVDEIARAIPEFYFGRFDLRFRDEESFQRGEEFKIVEINGAGAEATHIWDAEARLLDVYLTLFEQWKVIFAIAAQNRERGFRPLGVVQYLKDIAAYRRQARGYPMTH